MWSGSCNSPTKPVSGFHQELVKNIELSLWTFGDIDIGLVVGVVVVGCRRIVDQVVFVQTLYSYCDIIIIQRNRTQFLLICHSKTNLETGLYRKPEILLKMKKTFKVKVNSYERKLSKFPWIKVLNLSSVREICWVITCWYSSLRFYFIYCGENVRFEPFIIVINLSPRWYHLILIGSL